MKNISQTVYNIADLREIAKRRLPKGVFEFVDRGSDVVKALALGAKAVLIGRPTLYGTAVGGEAGAARAITLFREEIDRTLALIGCRSVAALNRDYLSFADAGVLPQAAMTTGRSSHEESSSMERISTLGRDHVRQPVGF